MANIISFLKDSTGSASLRKEFLKTIDNSNAEELCQWLNEKGYDAAIHECNDLISKRKKTQSTNLYAMPY